MRSELKEVKPKKWTANSWDLKDISFSITPQQDKIDYFLLPTAMEPRNNFNNLKLDFPQSPIFS